MIDFFHIAINITFSNFLNVSIGNYLLVSQIVNDEILVTRESATNLEPGLALCPFSERNTIIYSKG